MRLLIIGGPVMYVGSLDEAWRFGRRGVERTLLRVKGSEGTGGAVAPLAFFCGCEPHYHLAAAIPEGRHRIGVKSRRFELGLKLHVHIWITMRGKIGRR